MGQIPSREISLGGDIVCLLRTIEKHDAPDVLSHTRTVGGETDFLTFGKEGIDLTIEEAEKQTEHAQSEDNHLFILAEVDGEIVGTLGFTGGGRARIRHTGDFGMAVAKAYWGKGVGKALLEALMDWAGSAGIRKINLRVRSDNARAIALYRSFGFREEGQVTREHMFQGEFFDNIVMGLEM